MIKPLSKHETVDVPADTFNVECGKYKICISSINSKTDDKIWISAYKEDKGNGIQIPFKDLFTVIDKLIKNKINTVIDKLIKNKIKE